MHQKDIKMKVLWLSNRFNFLLGISFPASENRPFSNDKLHAKAKVSRNFFFVVVSETVLSSIEIQSRSVTGLWAETALYHFSADFFRPRRFRAVFLDRDHFRVAVVLDRIDFRPWTS